MKADLKLTKNICVSAACFSGIISIWFYQKSHPVKTATKC